MPVSDGCQPLTFQLCGGRPGNNLFYLIGGQERRIFEVRNDSAGRVAFIKDEPRAKTLQSLQTDQRIGISASIVEFNIDNNAFLAAPAPQGEALCNLMQSAGLPVRVVNYAF